MPISQRFLYLQENKYHFLKVPSLFIWYTKNQKSVESFILKNANQKRNQHAYK